MQAIILFEGLEPYLSSNTDYETIALTKVGNKPFIEYTLDRLRDAGIKEIIFILKQSKKTIEKYLANGYCFGLSIHYVYVDDILCLSAAIENAKKHIKMEYALLLHGNIFCDMNYNLFLTFSNNSNCDLTLVINEVSDISNYKGVVLDEYSIKGFDKKVETHQSGIVSSGVYYVKIEILSSLIKSNMSLEDTIASELLEKNKCVRGYLNNQYFINMGIPEECNRFIHNIKVQNDICLDNIISELDKLIDLRITASSYQLLEWKAHMRFFIQYFYGINSEEYHQFEIIKFEPGSVKVSHNSKTVLEENCSIKLKAIREYWINMKYKRKLPANR